MKKQTAKRWPVAIGLSIFAIFLACVATVMLALENPVEMSDLGMQGYHEYDANANKIIAAKIEFDKNYDIKYISEKLDQNSAVIAYRITDKAGNPVNDASVNIMITRPYDHSSDMPLESPKISDGVYTFESIVLPEPGRWNIMANVQIKDKQRYYSIKADTRYSEFFEY